MQWIDSRLEDPLQVLNKRRLTADAEIRQSVSDTIEAVRARGDAAVLAHARQFDCPSLQKLHVSSEEFEAAESALAEREKASILAAIDRVMRFHEAQIYYLTETMDRVESTESRFEGVPEASYRWAEETDHGGELGQRLLPVRRAGIYVPGGQAKYPSSVIMNVGPANVAMVRNVTITSPAGHDGSLAPAVLFAARQMLVNQVVKVGGAAAVAALALGTETIERVDVIAGPGNRFVNEAKRQLWGVVGLDGYAGPSEVCVLADDTANAAYAAADLITQVEHAEDNSGFLVCCSEGKAREIQDEIDRQLQGAPRAETISRALQKFGMIFVCKDLVEAVDVVNAIAPEHLTIAVDEPDTILPLIQNAGCVLIGEWSPESAGDYAAGPSHTLPTAGGARFASPLNVMHFLKFQSVVHLTREDLAEFRPTIEAFAAMEGLPAHGLGAAIRFDEESASLDELK